MCEREKRSALVVDDEQAVCAVMAAQLRDAGFDVTETLDGSHALRALHAGAFDLIVCDLTLQAPSGPELARTARKLSPDTAIIIVSGESNPDIAAGVLEADVDEYLVKPFGGEQLAISATAAFRRRREQTAIRRRVSETKAVVRAAGAPMKARSTRCSAGLHEQAACATRRPASTWSE